MSWKVVKLGTLISESRIPSETPNIDKRIRVKLNVKGVEKRPVGAEKEGATKQFIRKAGQFIYGKQNFHKGAFGVIPPELDGFETSADIPSFDVREDCLPEWIYYFFKAGNRYIELNGLARGVGSQRIHPKQLESLEIQLPPVNVQRNIIAELKMIEKDNLSTELTHQLSLVKQLRQSFLREAMQGKLVAQNPNDEPASVLLEKIKAEKEQLIKEKKIKKQKPLPPITKEVIPFEIPENWVWCRLGEICVKIGSGSTPKGSNYSESGFPFFRSQNIRNNGLDYNDIKYISNAVQEKMEGTTVFPNDILLNITGGSLGRCALVPPDFTQGNVSQHVSIVRPIQSESSFIHQLILSPLFQKYIFNSTTGAGREGLPKYNLEQFVIPLPPLSEQQRIVSKLDDLMAYCDSLEESIKNSQELNKKLLGQVLREALEPEGKVVDV